MTFEYYYKVAEMEGRFPHDTGAILLDIKAILQNLLQETSYEKKERIESEFESLQQGPTDNHAGFHARFRMKVQDMTLAGLQKGTDEDRLFRQCIRISGKLS